MKYLVFKDNTLMSICCSKKLAIKAKHEFVKSKPWECSFYHIVETSDDMFFSFRKGNAFLFKIEVELYSGVFEGVSMFTSHQYYIAKSHESAREMAKFPKDFSEELKKLCRVHASKFK